MSGIRICVLGFFLMFSGPAWSLSEQCEADCTVYLLEMQIFADETLLAAPSVSLMPGQRSTLERGGEDGFRLTLSLSDTEEAEVFLLHARVSVVGGGDNSEFIPILDSNFSLPLGSEFEVSKELDGTAMPFRTMSLKTMMHVPNDAH